MSDQLSDGTARPTPRTDALIEEGFLDRYNDSNLASRIEEIERESDARAERIAELEKDVSDLIDERNVAFEGVAYERAIAEVRAEEIKDYEQRLSAAQSEIVELKNLATMLLGPCNPPLDCSREELVAFINSLTPGQRVIERGQSGMIGQTGTVILYDGRISVRWDTIFKEGTGMVTSVTGGTRRIEYGSLLATKESENAKMLEALENIVTHAGNFSECVISLSKCGQIARRALAGKEEGQ